MLTLSWGKRELAEAPARLFFKPTGSKDLIASLSIGRI